LGFGPPIEPDNSTISLIDPLIGQWRGLGYLGLDPLGQSPFRLSAHRLTVVRVRITFDPRVNPGIGKTMLATGLARKAVEAGYRMLGEVWRSPALLASSEPLLIAK
jgi:hypothetical protein